MALAQFDDQGGTLRLDVVEIELDTSVVGGGTTTGTGGQPTRVLARLGADLLLGSQVLVTTEAEISANVSNSGPSQSFSFFDSDSDQATITGPGLPPGRGRVRSS